MILKPLHEFVCDTCGEVIASPQDGVVESLTNDDHKEHSFRIVHRAYLSPRVGREGHCYSHYDRKGFGDLSLEYFVAGQPDCMANLLGILDYGPLLAPDEESGLLVVSVREWREFALRVSVPYYEQARLYFGDAAGDGEFEGLHERNINSRETLKHIVEKYHQAADEGA